jgi:hypothetical protein
MPLDERDIRLLRSKRTAPSMLAFDVVLTVAFMIYLIVAEPGFFTFWTSIGLGILVLVMALLAFHVNDEQRSLRKDLETGMKIYRDGRISSVYTHEDGESSTTYRIDVVLDDPRLPMGFSVPQEVYQAVEEGQTARIAYAPLSRILLELRTASCVHLAAR